MQVNVLMLFIFIVISGIPLFIQVPTLTFSVLNTFIVKQCIAVNKYLFDTYVHSHLNKSVGNYACIVHLVGFKKNEKSLWTEIHVYYIALLL